MGLARLKRFASLAIVYAHLPKESRKCLFDSKETINFICEIALNILKRNLRLSSKNYKAVLKYKKIIKFLADKSKKIALKRKILRGAKGKKLIELLFLLLRPIKYIFEKWINSRLNPKTEMKQKTV